jgi:serine/threonine-protein kinase RsbW
MFPVRRAVRRQDVANYRFRYQGLIRSTFEMTRVMRAVIAAMQGAGYHEKDLFGMHIALEEAIVNAVKHGHHGDSTQPVWVSCRVGAQRVLAAVEDRGSGFDPRQVADPRTAENLERPSGRGLLLMRHYMTSVRFNARGNRVILCKCRSRLPA